MSRFKIVLLSLFAVFAFAAVASATASADECNGGSHWVFCYWPSNEPIHLLVALGTSGLSVLATKVGTVEVKLHCKDDLFRALLHLLGYALGEIDFLGCKVEKPANCVIPALLLAHFELQVTSGTTATATGSGPGEEFVKIPITGCSEAEGEHPITGSQLLELPEGEVGKVEHEIVAKKAGSHLKFGAEEASFSSTATVHLESESSWLIMKGV